MKSIVLLLPILALSLTGCSNGEETSSSSALTPEEIYQVEHGVKPTFNEEKTSLTYGLYPQTLIEDEELLGKLNALGDSDKTTCGWYMLDGDYYVKDVATPKANSVLFEDGKEYWFKCEPIRWYILNYDKANSEYFLLSSVILDAQAYYEGYGEREEIDLDDTSENPGKVTVKANNYKYSDIRKFLTNDFYNSAFSLHSDYVLTTHVDNGPKSADQEENPYLCEDTDDKVFILSYQDYLNEDLGFNGSKSSDYWETSTRVDQHSRKAELTDYATSKDKRITFNSCTRTPEVDGYGLIWSIADGGSLQITYASGTKIGYNTDNYKPEEWGYGVRPAITIKF